MITTRNGDLNLLGRFIPFASPIEEAWGRWHQAATKAASEENTRQTTPRKPTVLSPFSDLPHGFQRVLRVFRDENVGVVIRLNDEL
jgi:cell division cycle 14